MSEYEQMDDETLRAYVHNLETDDELTVAYRYVEWSKAKGVLDRRRDARERDRDHAAKRSEWGLPDPSAFDERRN